MKNKKQADVVVLEYGSSGYSIKELFEYILKQKKENIADKDSRIVIDDEHLPAGRYDNFEQFELALQGYFEGDGEKVLSSYLDMNCIDACYASDLWELAYRHKNNISYAPVDYVNGTVGLIDNEVFRLLDAICNNNYSSLPEGMFNKLLEIVKRYNPNLNEEELALFIESWPYNFCGNELAKKIFEPLENIPFIKFLEIIKSDSLKLN